MRHLLGLSVKALSPSPRPAGHVAAQAFVPPPVRADDPHAGKPRKAKHKGKGAVRTPVAESLRTRRRGRRVPRWRSAPNRSRG